MNLIDIHCHLTHESFTDLDQVLKRAKNVGFKAIVVSGVNPVSNKQVMVLTEKYPLIKASLGIYPIDALGKAESDVSGFPRQTIPIDLEEQFQYIERNKDKIVSIGEVGMDFHWADKEETLEKQTETFRKIIRFAIKINKPIVIHSRKAEKECIDVMEEEITNHEIPIVNHCFSGKKSQIRKAAELGHYFSIPPNIIRSHSFQTLVKIVDLKQLLTETDAPYLSPYPEQRNEPAFVVETIKKIAEIKEITVEETAEQIWKNYQKVFGI